LGRERLAGSYPGLKFQKLPQLDRYFLSSYSEINPKMFDFIKNISSTELIIIVLILVVFFGGKAITSLARSSGETVKEVKKIKKEFISSIEGDDDKPDKK